MVDIPPRAFNDDEFSAAQKNLTKYFNSNFPLPQNQSWKENWIPEKLAPCVISCLHGGAFMMESLQKMPGIGISIGVTGDTNAPNT